MTVCPRIPTDNPRFSPFSSKKRGFLLKIRASHLACRLELVGEAEAEGVEPAQFAPVDIIGVETALFLIEGADAFVRALVQDRGGNSSHTVRQAG